MSWIAIEDELPPQGTAVLLRGEGNFDFVGYRDGADYYGVLDGPDVPVEVTVVEWMYIPE